MDESTQNEQGEPSKGAGLDREMFLLDSNIFDKLAAEPEAFVCELRRAVVDAGRMRLLITHIQEDELNRIPDPDHRELLRSIMTTLTEQTNTVSAMYGVSRYGKSTYKDEEGSTIQDWMKGNRKHAEDALIANTARLRGFILVTEDQRMTTRASMLGVTVWDYARFRVYMCGIDR